jgi:hypothetical protein
VAVAVGTRPIPDEDGCPARPSPGARAAALTALTGIAGIAGIGNLGGFGGFGGISGVAAIAGRIVTSGVDRYQRPADREPLAGAPVRGNDRAGERGRDFDQRFRRLDLDQRLVDGDGVTGGDEPLDDFGVG